MALRITVVRIKGLKNTHITSVNAHSPLVLWIILFSSRNFCNIQKEDNGLLSMRSKVERFLSKNSEIK